MAVEACFIKSKIKRVIVAWLNSIKEPKKKNEFLDLIHHFGKVFDLKLIHGRDQIWLSPPDCTPTPRAELSLLNEMCSLKCVQSIGWLMYIKQTFWAVELGRQNPYTNRNVDILFNSTYFHCGNTLSEASALITYGLIEVICTCNDLECRLGTARPSLVTPCLSCSQSTYIQVSASTYTFSLTPLVWKAACIVGRWAL